ncbi:zf-HC2 domain-containing protein [Streptomyces sp. NPDC006368]|uniref:zf-HC2 domain-containing protein n=1 Tax=Streptomyces sp. NPDC006368 TaxID=3156760 RepID=UPI0033BC3823
MTSTDTAQHPDVSEISDLTEGLLSPSRTADVRRHLDGCALCADVRTSLEEIRGLLGTLPGPARMPADIAGRIDAALAAEALLDATAPMESGHVSRETAVPDSTAHATSQAADPVRADRPAGRPRAATGPGRGRSLRHRRRNVTLGAVFGAAVIGASVLLLQSVQPSGDSGDGARTTESTVSAPATFAGSPLEKRVETLLTTEALTKAPKQEQDRSIGANTLKRSEDVPVPPCIRAGIGRTDPALAAELGDYQGKRAFLVVLSHPNDTRQVEAYILDAACTTTKAPKADVLLTRSYPHP